MLHRGLSFLCLCIVAMQLFQVAVCMPPIVDPETRARLEAKVISSMSLRDIEEMVENDDRIRNAPKSSKLIIIPKKKTGEALIGEDDREAIIIHRKPKKYSKQAENVEYRFADFDADSSVRRSSYDPGYAFESEFNHREDDFPFFRISDLESASSSPARKFYDSLVNTVMRSENFGLSKDPLAILEMAASEDVPQYKPRFDYDGYSKDSTETKLSGKPYWRDAPERRDETIDENGCRTVVKKVVDPEDEKKVGSEKAKTVVITKECESPNINGPDAKIPDVTPLTYTARFDNEPSSEFASYDTEPISYDQTRPDELNFRQTETKDPLAPDYIDSMLDKHFKSFPFSNPLSSFKGYQDRFKLRIPEGFKDVKPTVGVESYEYSSPKSGFEEERKPSAVQEDSSKRDSPKTYEHHYHYDYPPQSPRKPEYDDEREPEPEKKSTKEKDPKMMKKSFAYYRKDNPKDDPNDHQYAEEYAQGNFRSFSSSYDSEKDGPKKKQ